MIEQKSLFSQKVGGGGGLSPPSPPGSAGPACYLTTVIYTVLYIP